MNFARGQSNSADNIERVDSGAKPESAEGSNSDFVLQPHAHIRYGVSLTDPPRPKNSGTSFPRHRKLTGRPNQGYKAKDVLPSAALARASRPKSESVQSRKAFTEPLTNAPRGLAPNPTTSKALDGKSTQDSITENTSASPLDLRTTPLGRVQDSFDVKLDWFKRPVFLRCIQIGRYSVFFEPYVRNSSSAPQNAKFPDCALSTSVGYFLREVLLQHPGCMKLFAREHPEFQYRGFFRICDCPGVNRFVMNCPFQEWNSSRRFGTAAQ